MEVGVGGVGVGTGGVAYGIAVRVNGIGGIAGGAGGGGVHAKRQCFGLPSRV